MICKRDYFMSISEEHDVVLANLRIDSVMIGVMRAALILEMKETSKHLTSDMDPDEYIDSVNHIKDLVRSLEALDESLHDIDAYTERDKGDE